MTKGRGADLDEPTLAGLAEMIVRLEPAGRGWPIEFGFRLPSPLALGALEETVQELAIRTGMGVSVGPPPPGFGGVAWSGNTLRRHSDTWNDRSQPPAGYFFSPTDPREVVVVAQHRLVDGQGMMRLAASVAQVAASRSGWAEENLAALQPAGLRSLPPKARAPRQRVLTHPPIWANLGASWSQWVVETRGPLRVTSSPRKITARVLAGIASRYRTEYPKLKKVNVMVTTDLRIDRTAGVANQSLAANVLLSLEKEPLLAELDRRLDTVRSGEDVRAYWETLRRATLLSRRWLTRPIVRVAKEWVAPSVIIANLGDSRVFQGGWGKARLVVPVRSGRVPSVGLVSTGNTTYLTVTMSDGRQQRERARLLADSIADRLEE